MTKRQLGVETADADWLKQKAPECEIALRLDSWSYFCRDGSCSHETHYYLTSIDPSLVTLSLLMRVLRGHWQVENCLHWLKDRYWREDKHYLKRPGLGAAYASLTNGAVAVLRLLMGSNEVMMKAKAENIHDAPKKYLKKLGFK